MELLENEGIIATNMSWLIYNVLTASRRIWDQDGCRVDISLLVQQR